MRAAVWGASVGAVLAMPLQAETLLESFELGGVALEIVESDDLEKELRFENQVLLQDYTLQLEEESLAFGAVEARVGWSGAGGNTCPAAPFVLFAAEGKVSAELGPNTCRSFEAAREGEAIVFTSPPWVGQTGERWMWQYPEGFSFVEETLFGPRAETTWADVAGLGSAHPVEALQIAPVYDLVRKATGTQFTPYITSLAGVGSGQLLKGGYGGFACDLAVCEEVFAGLWIDWTAQAVYLAWAAEEGGLHLVPEDIESWPVWAAENLGERVAFN